MKKSKSKEYKQISDDVDRTLDLFVSKTPILRKKFVDAVLFQMQLTGTCFMDFLNLETKLIDDQFSQYKKLLPKTAKRKKS